MKKKELEKIVISLQQTVISQEQRINTLENKLTETNKSLCDYKRKLRKHIGDGEWFEESAWHYLTDEQIQDVLVPRLLDVLNALKLRIGVEK